MADTKEVRFDLYCKTCAHKDLKEDEKPCDDCLQHPANLNSHKPVRWKKQED